jgi:hypothetical protein
VRTKLTDLLTGRCRHQKTIVVRSSGMERIVCEGCGRVSFSFDGDGPYPVDPDPAIPHLVEAVEV